MTTAAQERSIPTPLGLLLATVAGIAMPAQGRVNGALAAELGSGTLAALVSFTVGLVIVGLGVLIFPKSRSSIKQLPTFLKEQRFPWWYMLAGVIGAYFVLGQGLTITLLGVALFTVANVAGQTISGLFTDAIGFGPGGKRPITGIRFIGSFLAIVGVLWAVWPKIAAQGASGDWLLPVLFPLSAGLLFAFQQAMNGTQTRYYRTPLPATFFNFAAGTLALGVVVLITSFGNPLTGHFPTEWWMYLGGAFGNVFIATGAILVRHMGVLLTGLGLVAGQLLGSLALDVFAPVPGSVVDANTLWGTALTLVAVMIASIPSSARMPWEKR